MIFIYDEYIQYTCVCGGGLREKSGRQIQGP